MYCMSVIVVSSQSPWGTFAVAAAVQGAVPRTCRIVIVEPLPRLANLDASPWCGASTLSEPRLHTAAGRVMRIIEANAVPASRVRVLESQPSLEQANVKSNIDVHVSHHMTNHVALIYHPPHLAGQLRRFLAGCANTVLVSVRGSVQSLVQDLDAFWVHIELPSPHRRPLGPELSRVRSNGAGPPHILWMPHFPAPAPHYVMTKKSLQVIVDDFAWHHSLEAVLKVCSRAAAHCAQPSVYL